MRRLFAVLPFLALVACGPDFERLRIDAIVPSALGGRFSPQELSVPEGLALKANITALDDDGEPMRLSIRASDPTIVGVESVVTARGYTFIGRRAGTTDLFVEADDELVLTIRAVVTTQPWP